MQIDLQPPLAITKITDGDSQLKFEREGNVYWVMFEKEIPKGAEDKIELLDRFEGFRMPAVEPVAATPRPIDGGWVLRDSETKALPVVVN